MHAPGGVVAVRADPSDAPHAPPQDASPSPPVLTLERVGVDFGKLRAVRDVSLRLGRGHLLGLIGPNGAGKTTLLRAVCGIQPPTRGRVLITGQLFTPDAADLRRLIGFTPDTPPLYDELTVRTFLRFIARGYDMTTGEADERIDFWLEKVWLTEKADAKIKQLSRGMRQRIGIARTLLPNPSLVVLDEPAAGLDPAGRVQFRQLLTDLRRMDKALIVSSHILSDLSEYCTHIGIMAGGQLIRCGTVEAVTAHGGDAARVRYTATLAADGEQDGTTARAARALAELGDVTDVRPDGARLTFEYAAGKAGAARALAALVKADVPVAGFVADVPGLEQAYLKTGIKQVE